jgi:hypothetical protein
MRGHAAVPSGGYMISVWVIEWKRAGEVQQVWPDRVTGEPSCIEDDRRSKRKGRKMRSLLPAAREPVRKPEPGR